MSCLVCEGESWVCENHPDQPWNGPHACSAAELACPARNAIRRATSNRHDCRPASSTTKVRQLASKGWLTRFDEPIVLDDGTTLTTTLRQAIEYLAKTVPKAEHNHEKVLSAADHLTRSAEQNYPMFFARAATLQAIHRNRERVFNPDRKDHHWASASLRGTNEAPVLPRCALVVEAPAMKATRSYVSRCRLGGLCVRGLHVLRRLGAIWLPLAGALLLRKVVLRAIWFV
jgi:hypothetical protein